MFVPINLSIDVLFIVLIQPFNRRTFSDKAKAGVHVIFQLQILCFLSSLTDGLKFGFSDTVMDNIRLLLVVVVLLLLLMLLGPHQPWLVCLGELGRGDHQQELLPGDAPVTVLDTSMKIILHLHCDVCIYSNTAYLVSKIEHLVDFVVCHWLRKLCHHQPHICKLVLAKLQFILKVWNSSSSYLNTLFT